MNWAWVTSLDQVWRSPAFPMWLTLAAAGFFGLMLLITLVRAEKSVANGALTVITLLAIGIAVAATIRVYGPAGRSASNEVRSTASAAPALPALSCIDDLAGEVVGSACEKVVFGSPEFTAAAVSYTASLIGRLTALGDVATAKPNMTMEMLAIRKALERDRYGLVAQVLTTREGCTQTQCPVFRSLMDSRQIASNMGDHVFDLLVARYAPSWNAPPPATAGPLAALPQSVPTGRPTNAEFPSSANTPAVSIMTPEPGTGSSVGGQRPAQSAGGTAKQPPAAAPPPTTAASPPASAMASAKKQAATKQRPAAPTSLAPGAPEPAQAPAASND
jgi:hypothetical protein